MASPPELSCKTAPANVWQGVLTLSQAFASLPERAETKTRFARPRATGAGERTTSAAAKPQERAKRLMVEISGTAASVARADVDGARLVGAVAAHHVVPDRLDVAESRLDEAGAVVRDGGAHHPE